MAISFGQRLADCKGIGPGFDIARVGLALAVVCWHAVGLISGSWEYARNSPLWFAGYAILPMFFALSGFLVTGSALRLPLREYILNRTFRIIPALGVDIGLSALVLGPVFTTLALADYFTSAGFYAYFLNIIGWVHFRLPGVFETSNARGIVNGSLWTVPYEMVCYIIMSLAIATGLIRRWSVACGVALGWIAIAAVIDLAGLATGDGIGDKVVRFVFIDRGAVLVPSFLLGSALYLARDKVPFRGDLAALSAAIILGVSVFLPADKLWSAPWLTLLTIGPMVYLVIWCGLADLPKPGFLARGDYSYGIYLYHAPILAAVCELAPPDNVFSLLAIAGGPIIVFAMLSWHLIEKPTLKLRRRFSLVGARLAAHDAAPEPAVSGAAPEPAPAKPGRPSATR